MHIKNSEITFKHIANHDELITYQDDIMQLFQECFLYSFDEKIWKWAYIDNPMGNPIINLAFMNKKLVGHYAFIPIATTNYRTLLSLTTMVDPLARKYNVFFDLAKRAYDFAKENYYDFIIGFPNKKSALIHEKILNWEILQTFVAQCDLNNLSNTFQISNPLQQSCMLDLFCNDFINWRISKPNITYHKKKNTIYKYYGGNIDLLTQRENDGYPNLFAECKLNFITSDSSLEYSKIFDYPFAIKGLRSKNIPNFYPELLMSDIF